MSDSTLIRRGFDARHLAEPRVTTLDKPEIIIQQSVDGTVSLFETQNLNLDCKVNNWSREEYNVQWITFEGYILSDNGHLSIESVIQRKNQGEYTCAVQHKQNDQDVYREKVNVVIKG